MTFNDRDYTRDAIIKQLGLIELHSKDGSAVEAGCACIETKHLFMLEGLAEEGMGFALSEKERRFYKKLAEQSRQLRKNIDMGSFNFPSVSSNSKSPAHGLSKCEAEFPAVQRELTKCLQTKSLAECRALIKCPP